MNPRALGRDSSFGRVYKSRKLKVNIEKSRVIRVMKNQSNYRLNIKLEEVDELIFGSGHVSNGSERERTID